MPDPLSSFLGPPWELGVAIVYFLLLLIAQGLPVVLSLQMPRLEDEAPSPSELAGGLPSLSVIIPARNEEDDLRACLDSLERQDYRARGGSLEVIVVDGGSTDGTAAVARAHPLGARLLEEPPLPPGWVGKNWACQKGSEEARGSMLLFLDADVRLAPSTLRRAVRRAQKDRSALLSLAAHIEMGSFWERVVMPLFTQFVLLYFVAPRVNRPGSSRAMANGQFMLFTAEGYRRLGGHALVRGYVLEDVQLAREVKRRGLGLTLYWDPDGVTTRMYTHRAEMREGLLKNLHGTEFSAARQLGLLAALALFYLGPFATLALSLAGVLPPLWGVLSGLLVILTAAKQCAFQRALEGGKDGLFGLLYPVGIGYYLGLLASSLRRGLGDGSVDWKGRSYPVRPPEKE